MTSTFCHVAGFLIIGAFIGGYLYAAWDANHTMWAKREAFIAAAQVLRDEAAKVLLDNGQSPKDSWMQGYVVGVETTAIGFTSTTAEAE